MCSSEIVPARPISIVIELLDRAANDAQLLSLPALSTTPHLFLSLCCHGCASGAHLTPHHHDTHRTAISRVEFDPCLQSCHERPAKHVHHAKSTPMQKHTYINFFSFTGARILALLLSRSTCLVSHWHDLHYPVCDPLIPLGLFNTPSVDFGVPSVSYRR